MKRSAPRLCPGLQLRGFATTRCDPHDSRQLNVALTAAGQDYARAVIAVIDELNREVARRVEPAQLAAADAVLRAVLFDASARQRAGWLPRPGS